MKRVLFDMVLSSSPPPPIAVSSRRKKCLDMNFDRHRNPRQVSLSSFVINKFNSREYLVAPDLADGFGVCFY